MYFMTSSISYHQLFIKRQHSGMGQTKTICRQITMFTKAFSLRVIKGGPSDLGNKNTKKSSLYSQSLLTFIPKTPVVENHPTRGEISDSLQTRSTPTGNMVNFYLSSSFAYWKYTEESFNHGV